MNAQDRMAAAILYLDAHYREQPSLDRVAAAVHMSPFHFQREFGRSTGVSPKRFLQCLTLEHAKQWLERDGNLLDTALEVGLSSPSRLHDHFITLEAMTPGDYKRGARGMTIRYGVHLSPFGRVLIAMTDRGVCGLEFVDGSSERAQVAQLIERWPNATFAVDREGTASVARRLFELESQTERPLHLVVRGTNFQINVWRALLRVPFGEMRSYEQIAASIGAPTALRAVGSAIGRNPVALLIPCHRVIRKTGAIGEYHWGAQRKRALLAWEAAKAS